MTVIWALTTVALLAAIVALVVVLSIEVVRRIRSRRKS